VAGGSKGEQSVGRDNAKANRISERTSFGVMAVIIIVRFNVKV